MSRPPSVKKKIGEKRRERRDAFWPDASTVVYSPSAGGWAQMPRTVPMIASLIDSVSGKENPGRMYVVLWAYEFGDGFVEVPDPVQLAVEAGYLSDRAERTFTERMQTLMKLGFIRAQGSGLRSFSYVLLVDPHVHVVRWRKRSPHEIPDAWWTAFQARCATIGVSLSEASMDEGTVVRPRRTKQVLDRAAQVWKLSTDLRFRVSRAPVDGWVGLVLLAPLHPETGAHFEAEFPAEEFELA
ncbi:MAG: hypothetical protein SFX73_38040 [Kofleriaceae bacterium]|nr:hypothetical protein [Kofleriaceae bacterium]